MYAVLRHCMPGSARSSKRRRARPGRAEEEEAEEEERSCGLGQLAKRLVPSDDVFDGRAAGPLRRAPSAFTPRGAYASGVVEEEARPRRARLPQLAAASPPSPRPARDRRSTRPQLHLHYHAPRGARDVRGAARPGRSVPPFPSNLQKRRGRPPPTPCSSQIGAVDTDHSRTASKSIDREPARSPHAEIDLARDATSRASTSLTSLDGRTIAPV